MIFPQKQKKQKNYNMGAPAGNQFWKLRSKHGRDKLFATPDLLWEAACEYFEWCEKNPFEEIDYRGKDAKKVILPKMRPFTIHGLCSYLDCNTNYFKDFDKATREKTDDVSKGFSSVLTRIKETIYNQKFSGAAAGFLNHSIIARDLGLADKKQLGGEGGGAIKLVFEESAGCDPIDDGD